MTTEKRTYTKKDPLLLIGLSSVETVGRDDVPANVTDGLFAIAEALGEVAAAIQRLGTGNADTGGWGAIESLSMKVHEGLNSIASAIGDSVDVGLDSISSAVNDGLE